MLDIGQWGLFLPLGLLTTFLLNLHGHRITHNQVTVSLSEDEKEIENAVGKDHLVTPRSLACFRWSWRSVSRLRNPTGSCICGVREWGFRRSMSKEILEEVLWYPNCGSWIPARIRYGMERDVEWIAPIDYQTKELVWLNFFNCLRSETYKVNITMVHTAISSSHTRKPFWFALQKWQMKARSRNSMRL